MIKILSLPLIILLSLYLMYYDTKAKSKYNKDSNCKFLIKSFSLIFLICFLLVLFLNSLISQ